MTRRVPGHAAVSLESRRRASMRMAVGMWRMKKRNEHGGLGTNRLVKLQLTLLHQKGFVWVQQQLPGDWGGDEPSIPKTK